MSKQDNIKDADLQAYVDGELDEAARAEVEAYLADDPSAAARVRRIRTLNEALRRAYTRQLTEPVPGRLKRAVARHKPSPLLRMAAAIAWMVVGGGLGWWAHGKVPGGFEAMATHHLVQPASFAHAVFTTDARRPVEIRAEQETDLVNWLSSRLHTTIRAPDLSRFGFVLVGGRLLPSTDRMAAQFMYENDHAARVTLYIRRGQWEDRVTAFRFAQANNVSVAYWIDGELGYALSGDMEGDALRALAEAVHNTPTS